LAVRLSYSERELSYARDSCSPIKRSSAMRKEAAKHGADAIFIELGTKEGGWRFGFSRFGGEGGSFSDVQYRARAIVWK
jgi:hypothetical protein